jgi:hypothetical protein
MATASVYACLPAYVNAKETHFAYLFVCPEYGVLRHATQEITRRRLSPRQ